MTKQQLKHLLDLLPEDAHQIIIKNRKEAVIFYTSNHNDGVFGTRKLKPTVYGPGFRYELKAPK